MPGTGLVEKGRTCCWKSTRSRTSTRQSVRRRQAIASRCGVRRRQPCRHQPSPSSRHAIEGRVTNAQANLTKARSRACQLTFWGHQGQVRAIALVERRCLIAVAVRCCALQPFPLAGASSRGGRDVGSSFGEKGPFRSGLPPRPSIPANFRAGGIGQWQAHPMGIEPENSRRSIRFVDSCRCSRAKTTEAAGGQCSVRIEMIAIHFNAG